MELIIKIHEGRQKPHEEIRGMMKQKAENVQKNKYFKSGLK